MPSSSLTPTQRKLRAQIAANSRWSREDPTYVAVFGAHAAAHDPPVPAPAVPPHGAATRTLLAMTKQEQAALPEPARPTTRCTSGYSRGWADRGRRPATTTPGRLARAGVGAAAGGHPSTPPRWRS